MPTLEAVRCAALELRSSVVAVRRADRASIGAMYSDVVGYDIFVNDPTLDTEYGRELLLDYIREEALSWDIDPASIGLGV